ncbi:ABC transporter permease [Microlunatus antarcticus]|uniref:Peptide/nickel transport system permease protein n=1 Tax=Microlunatus antarcticus TaxID=53388 RepID=A0A7W5P943_9ACTN|nr:ABC transporter permease [Microlunatus antarcticus]MBB3328506.1 peptide/nickel transport system permease protein [Microlunatus antarcticus]
MSEETLRTTEAAEGRLAESVDRGAVALDGRGGAEEGPTRIQGRSPWQLAWERLRRDKIAMVSLAFIVLIVLFAVFAPLIAVLTGHGANQQFNDVGLTPDGLPRPPSGTFWFGTDDLGRDILVRCAYGARISLLVGVVATAFTIAVGVVLGLIAGYYGKIADTIISRIIDVVLAFPFLLFAIALVSIIGASLGVTIFVIAMFSWASVARIVRGQVLSIREREYIEAARSLGAGSTRIMFVDALPNVLAPIIVYATLLIPSVIVTEATLSFLGLGVPAPTATWGNMISEAQAGGLYQIAPWFLAFPSLLLLLLTLAFNLLGDGVRDAFDPRGDRMLQK